MVKKITIVEVSGKKVQKQAQKRVNKYYAKTKKTPPDTFEKTIKTTNLPNKETASLKFEHKKVEFFPEDVKKMESMTLEEKNAYMLKLKKEDRYNIVEK